MKINWNEKALAIYFNTIVERNAIYIKKEVLHESPPWTKDICFKEYRFCNVFRCLDKTFKLLEQLPGDSSTRSYWALRNMLRWTANNPLIAHLLENQQELLKRSSEGQVHAVEALIRFIVEDYTYRDGNSLVTGSFIVKRPGGLSGDLYMLRSIYEQSMELHTESWKGARTIERACALFQSKFPFCGSFTAYCIASDMMYKDYPLSMAGDRYYYAERGPGGVHGLAVLMSKGDGKVTPSEWRASIPYLVALWRDKGEELASRVLEKVDYALNVLTKKQQSELDEVARLIKDPKALDVEHWLCEFYKYYRGSAKKKYIYKE